MTANDLEHSIESNIIQSTWYGYDVILSIAVMEFSGPHWLMAMQHFPILLDLERFPVITVAFKVSQGHAVK